MNGKSQRFLHVKNVEKRFKVRTLDFSEYEEFTESTDISNQSLQFYLDGMSEESGELSGIFKRIRRGDYGTVPMVLIDKEKKGLPWVIDNIPEIKKALVSEIGDRFWYNTRFLNKIGVTWAEIMDYNHAKLKQRKEDGTIKGHGEERK